MQQIKNKLLNHPYITAFTCGLLAVGSLPPFYFFPLLFFTFPVLLWLVHNAKSGKQSFKIGYAFGFAFFAFGFSWIGNALLIEAATFGWLYPIAFLASGFFFGLFIALPTWLSFYFKNIISQYLAFCSLWVLSEWIRSFILTGFPWNLLGSVLAFHDFLIQFASIGGTYILSLLVLLSVSAPIFGINLPNKKNIFISIFTPLAILSFLSFYGFLRLDNASNEISETKIRLVQPAIPQSMKWNQAVLEDNFTDHIKLSQKKGMEDIDFIIWGETASPFPLDIDNYHLQNARYAIPKKGYLITGLVRYEFINDKQYNTYNSLMIIDSQGRIVGQYDKSHLVPFGEYIPLRSWLPDWIRPVANVIGTFKSGKGPQKIDIPRQPSLGALICYETIFPHQIIDRNNRPQWIVNLTNDGWYGDSAGPYQHLVAARLRAVEEGITIARAANTGISALISPYGKILGQIPLNQKGNLDINLPKNSEFSTFYTQNGNFLILLIVSLLISIAFLYLIVNKNTKFKHL